MEAVLKSLGEAIAALEKEYGFDWRISHSKMIPLEGGGLEIELSREEVWRALPARLEGFSVTRRGDDGHTVFLSAAGSILKLTFLAPDRARPLWVISSVADVRREPSHAAELLTQLIMGETAFPLKAEGDWFLVRLPDDYHGWIRSWYVRDADAANIAAYGLEARAVVEPGVGYVLTAPDAKSLPVSEVVAGTRIIAGAADGGFRAVTLPGGRSGFMREGDLALASPTARPDRGRLVERAMRYLGIPYLWGGTTPKGFDCSGLMMRVFGMEGVSLPRDSDRQSLVGERTEGRRVREIPPGDLLFFGEGGKVGHVAMSAGDGRFIHAYGEVKINSFDPGDERYDEKLANIFLFARSILR
jgi:hypothetical protein